MSADLLRLNLLASVAMGRLVESNLTVEQLSWLRVIIEAADATLVELNELRALRETPMVRGQYQH